MHRTLGYALLEGVNIVSRPFSNLLAIWKWVSVTVRLDDDEECFVLDQHAKSDICSVRSIK